MAIDNFIKTGIQSFTDGTAWGAGVPGSGTDAEINDSAFVGVGTSQTVKSIGTGSGNVLNITGGLFDTLNGTGANTNSGITAVAGATFEVSGETEDNTGKIELMGSGASLVLPASAVTLDGGGTIQMTIGGGPGSNIIESGNLNTSPTLINQNNTISGDGTIGDGLNFVNDGMVETNNSTSSNPGTLAILGTAGIFVSNSGNFTNNGTLQADPNGKLILGVDNVTGSIDNESNINLIYNGSGTSTELEIAGDMTITGLSHTGVIDMEGSDPLLGDAILSDGKAATLTLVNQTIEGGGAIGDFDLTLDNVSGTIDATGTGGSLYLGFEGQGPTMTNGGTFEATGGAFLNIQANVDNTGTITALGGGVVQLQSAITGPGAIDIGADSSMVAWSTVAGNITFTGTGADLEINNSLANGGIGGEIGGAVGSDTIDLTTDVTTFAAGDHRSWQQTTGNTGVLSLLNATIISLNLAGTYTSADFAVTADGSGIDQSTLITVLNGAPPPSTTEVMIMDQSASGNYEIYDLGNNAIQGYGALGQISTSLSVVQLGDFNGTDTADMLMHDGSTGEFWMYDVGGNNVTNANGTDMGNVGLSWSILGFGDFSSNAGETDMLMQNSNGAIELYDIANGQFSGFHSMGNVGTSWQVLGFGAFSSHAGESDMLMRNSANGNLELYDITNNGYTNEVAMGNIGTSWQVLGFGAFSGHAGEDDMLMRNSANGNIEVYDIANSGYTNEVAMGNIGTSWQVLGIGDFSGNPGESDMLMQNSANGAIELYDITNNGYTNEVAMGNVGLSWQVVGFGDFSGNPGEDDMLMRNNSNGTFELYDIAHSQFTNELSIGQVGTEWSVRGIAADPPGSAPANAQLAQVVAAFASSTSLDTSFPLGQPPTQPPTASPLAAPSGQPQPA